MEKRTKRAVVVGVVVVAAFGMLVAGIVFAQQWKGAEPKGLTRLAEFVGAVNGVTSGARAQKKAAPLQLASGVAEKEELGADEERDAKKATKEYLRSLEIDASDAAVSIALDLVLLRRFRVFGDKVSDAFKAQVAEKLSFLRGSDELVRRMEAMEDGDSGRRYDFFSGEASSAFHGLSKVMSNGLRGYLLARSMERLLLEASVAAAFAKLAREEGRKLGVAISGDRRAGIEEAFERQVAQANAKDAAVEMTAERFLANVEKRESCLRVVVQQIPGLARAAAENVGGGDLSGAGAFGALREALEAYAAVCAGFAAAARDVVGVKGHAESDVHAVAAHFASLKELRAVLGCAVRALEEALKPGAATGAVAEAVAEAEEAED